MSNDKNIITKTNDGYVVELFIKDQQDVDGIADGITLLENGKKLTEDQYVEKYRTIVEKYNEKRIMIKVAEEKNDEQLKAILRVAKEGDISILFAGVSSPIELIEFKEKLKECKQELNEKEIPYRNNIKIGTIVEIPSVALNAYETARECDFFFIETDSLIDYTFGNKKNIGHAKFGPAIIKLVKETIEGAHDAGIFCGISGNILENEIYLPLLIGLGIDEFTVKKESIEKIRKIINKIDKSDCKEIAEDIKHLTKEEEIEDKLKQFIKN